MRTRFEAKSRAKSRPHYVRTSFMSSLFGRLQCIRQSRCGWPKMRLPKSMRFWGYQAQGNQLTLDYRYQLSLDAKKKISVFRTRLPALPRFSGLQNASKFWWPENMRVELRRTWCSCARETLVFSKARFPCTRNHNFFPLNDVPLKGPIYFF